MSRNILILIILLVSGSACSDFLVQEPDKQVSITEQFSTQTGAYQAINGLYDALEGMVSEKFFFYADLLGGNITFTPTRHDHILEVPPGLNIEEAYEFRDEPEASNYSSVYTSCYEIINAANLILEHIDNTPDFTDQELKQIRAEVITVRAFCHYYVSIMYAQNYHYTETASHPGIVYVTHTLTAGVDYPSRLTMAETYEALVKDLEEAIGLFTGTPVFDYGPAYSYFNEISAKALFARVALQMNDWERAQLYAGEVIETSGIALMTKEEYIAEWEKPEEAVSEIILEMSAPRTGDEDIVSSSISAYFKYLDESDYDELVASDDLLDLYASYDIRSKMFEDYLLKTSVDKVIRELPYWFTKKLKDDPGTPILRLSEMYLIRAEALARLDENDVNAMNDLNTIRVRAGLDPVGSEADILEEIFLERRKELAFEGHLLFDIIRYKKDVERTQGCLSSVCSLSYPSDYFILPIPDSSVDLNENMDQNEGY